MKPIDKHMLLLETVLDSLLVGVEATETEIFIIFAHPRGGSTKLRVSFSRDETITVEKV